MYLILASMAIALCITISSERHTYSHKLHPRWYDHRRIIEGDETNIEKYPFALTVIFLNQDMYTIQYIPCGAFIVQKYWAISSAACALITSYFNSVHQNRVILRGNTTFIKGPDANNHWIRRVIVHEKYYVRESNLNDVGLLRVREPFVGANEAFISIAPRNYEYKLESTALIVGWGFTDPAVMKPSRVLRVGEVKLIDTNICRDIYTWFNFQNNGIIRMHVSNATTLCVKTYKSADCVGDSGGAVVQNGILIGLISARVECGSARFPPVYVKISAFNDWIWETIKWYNG